MNPVFPATVEDLRRIIARLSARNRAEQEVFGLTDAQLLARLAKCLRDGTHSETMFENGQPVYAMGVVDGFTWFIATEEWWAAGLAGVRLGRERMKAIRRAEGKPLISLSRSPRADAAKWFRLLGFEERPMRSVDGERMFVYP